MKEEEKILIEQAKHGDNKALISYMNGIIN